MYVKSRSALSVPVRKQGGQSHISSAVSVGDIIISVLENAK